MKNKSKELEVDFIGGQESLTKEEELIISAFIKANKKKNSVSKIENATRVSTKRNSKPYRTMS